jgi:hypothetical protein
MRQPPDYAKIPWRGTVVAVQPRIRLTRSFDERSHTYQGYVLRVDGKIGDETQDFLIAVGEGAHRKHHFRIGDQLSGEGHPVADPGLETSELYKAGTARKVPGRHGMSYTEEDWVDGDATSHRGPDE